MRAWQRFPNSCGGKCVKYHKTENIRKEIGSQTAVVENIETIDKFNLFANTKELKM